MNVKVKIYNGVKYQASSKKVAEERLWDLKNILKIEEV